MGSILLENATLGYGRRAILQGLNLRVEPGDFLVIGGPNGGGKSTLLKSITGLIPLLDGKREVAGVRFGYVPQQANAETPLPITAWEMVELGASAAFPPWQTVWGRARAFIRECLRECQAAEFARKPFAELSGGQRQRVLLARALATKPNVLILDEPTAGVDHETQQILARLLHNLSSEKRTSVVVVTHEPVVFRGMARFVRVSEGKLHPIPHHIAHPSAEPA